MDEKDDSKIADALDTIDIKVSKTTVGKILKPGEEISAISLF